MTLSQTETILLVDDEPSILKATRLMLQGHGFNSVATLQDSSEVISFLDSHPVAVLVLDLNMPGISGLELLSAVVTAHPGVSVIILTALDETRTAVECMQIGAFDYLVKPVESSRIVTTITRALEMHSLAHEMSSLKEYLLTDRLAHPEAFEGIITVDKKMRALFQYVEVIAPSRQPVLIHGETGVGKELLARAIHDVCCKKGLFVAVNVAGLDDSMFSDTLFGHKKGAFTSADQAREGLIAKAVAGTLFLDEIGDLNEASQIKLLRLLQEQEYYPVGSDTPKKCEARVVVATNKSLKEQMGAGLFRKDLYYRLCSHQIEIPPLRERPDDLPALLEHSVVKAAESMGKGIPGISPEVLNSLLKLQFPGNVRELEAMVCDAVARCNNGMLLPEFFPGILDDYCGTESAISTFSDRQAVFSEAFKDFFGHFPTMGEMENWLISEAMRESNGLQGAAAQILGITRQTLNKRLGEIRREKVPL